MPKSLFLRRVVPTEPVFYPVMYGTLGTGDVIDVPSFEARIRLSFGNVPIGTLEAACQSGVVKP